MRLVLPKSIHIKLRGKKKRNHVYEASCEKCGKKRAVKYPNIWFLVRKKRNLCLQCANKKINVTSFKKGHVSWNKGIGKKTAEIELLRHTQKYRDWRKAVFERDEYTCRICKKRGGELNADHIEQFSESKDKRFDVKNGRTLCISCHRKTENYGYKAVKLRLRKINK